VSSPNDVHSNAVARHLDTLGVKFTHWRPQVLISESVLTCELTNRKFDCRVAHCGSGQSLNRIELTDFQAVWLRRPGLVRSAHMPEIWLERFVEHESSQAIESIFRMLNCLWVNDPIRQREAMLKIHQLEVAKESGLTIPEILVTNNPESVREFYERHQGQIMYKLVDSESGLRFPIYELPRSIPSMPFRPIDLNYLNQVKSCVHLFQQRIVKTSDLRVTIVGNQIFTAEILSQHEGELLDWRVNENLPMKPYTLPDSVALKCFSLMRKLGLTYGALDFCVGADGQFVFLEINPHGQFLWIELALNMPISEAMARLLAGVEKPLEAVV
jgi:glutathione synthase/RimK-type ligase-like ATP-grasp enzyme